MDMQLRAEQPHDHAAVHDVHLRAFGASGAKVAALVDALRSDDPAALGLVAELAGEVVGHAMFSRSLLDAPRRLVVVQVLSPLGVRPDHVDAWPASKLSSTCQAGDAEAGMSVRSAM